MQYVSKSPKRVSCHSRASENINNAAADWISLYCLYCLWLRVTLHIEIIHTYHHCHGDNMDTSLLVSAIYQSLVVAIGIPGNCLIILVYTKKRQTMSPHVFILSLAIADLVFCLLTPAFIARRFFEYNSDFFCRLVTAFRYANVYFSAFLSSAIAVDRYLAICHPLLGWMTVPRAQIVAVSCMVLSVIVSIPVFAAYTVKFQQGAKTRTCMVDLDGDAPRWIVSLMLFSLYTSTISTMLVTAVMYWKMRKALRMSSAVHPNVTMPTVSLLASIPNPAAVGHGKQLQNKVTALGSQRATCNDVLVTSSSNNSNIKPTANILSKTSKMLLAASAIFFITWLIGIIAMSIPKDTKAHLKSSSEAGFEIINFLGFVFYINHAINPFIYGILNRRFREKCKKCFTSARICTTRNRVEQVLPLYWGGIRNWRTTGVC